MLVRARDAAKDASHKRNSQRQAYLHGKTMECAVCSVQCAVECTNVLYVNSPKLHQLLIRCLGMKNWTACVCFSVSQSGAVGRSEGLACWRLVQRCGSVLSAPPGPGAERTASALPVWLDIEDQALERHPSTDQKLETPHIRLAHVYSLEPVWKHQLTSHLSRQCTLTTTKFFRLKKKYLSDSTDQSKTTVMTVHQNIFLELSCES